MRQAMSARLLKLIEKVGLIEGIEIWEYEIQMIQKELISISFPPDLVLLFTCPAIPCCFEMVFEEPFLGQAFQYVSYAVGIREEFFMPYFYR